MGNYATRERLEAHARELGLFLFRELESGRYYVCMENARGALLLDDATGREAAAFLRGFEAARGHGYRAGSGLRISEPLHGGEREFRAGADVAYGWAEPDGSCGLTHAPDQGQLDRVAAALDAMEMDDVAALLSQSDTHEVRS